jgi:hypothetical protein
MTAVMANRTLIDGIDVVVQQPARHEEEVAYLQETVRQSYEQMQEARGRMLELLHHLLHRVAYTYCISRRNLRGGRHLRVR